MDTSPAVGLWVTEYSIEILDYQRQQVIVKYEGDLTAKELFISPQQRKQESGGSKDNDSKGDAGGSARKRRARDSHQDVPPS